MFRQDSHLAQYFKALRGNKEVRRCSLLACPYNEGI